MFSHSHSVAAAMPTTSPPKQGLARRAPRQARAREKIGLILDAAVRILDREGAAGLTTNRIAEVAGISVGTLYQYYANKQQVLEALARREVAQVLARVREVLAARPDAASGDRVRALVRVVLGAFGGRHRVRKLVLEAAMSGAGPASTRRESLHGALEVFVPMLVSGELRDARGEPIRLGELAARALSDATLGAIRGALARDPHALSEPSFEDALVALIRGFLNESTAAARRGRPANA